MIFQKLLLASTSLILGCSASGPIFERAPVSSKDQATVYFYRADTHPLSAVGAYFSIDGLRVSKLQRNAYTVHYVDKGQHTISMAWNCKMGNCSGSSSSMINMPMIEIELDVGEERFFKLNVEEKWLNDIYWSFEEVESNKALAELKNARLDNDL